MLAVRSLVKRRIKVIACSILIFTLLGCAGYGAAIKAGVVSGIKLHGKDLLTVVATNYAPGYAAVVGKLLDFLVSNASVKIASADTESDGEANGNALNPAPESACNDCNPLSFDKYESNFKSALIANLPQTKSAPAGQLVFRADILKSVDQGFVPIGDGSTLLDNGGQDKSDRFKVSFIANCDCYVYVIGIDSTGYVANIYPGRSGADSVALIEKNRNYVFPESLDQWLVLDTQKGIETVYFLFSRNPRENVLASLESLQGMSVVKNTETASAIEKPLLLNSDLSDGSTRGIRVLTIPNKPENYGSTTYESVSLADEGGVLVTRWFNHR